MSKKKAVVQEPKEVDFDEYDETSYGCCQLVDGVVDGALKDTMECEECQYRDSPEDCEKIRETRSLTKLKIVKNIDVHYYIADEEE